MTADKSQGRDKDCIIISMVRSNDAGNVSIFDSQQYMAVLISLNLVIRREIS
jgi:AAA domain